jgi:hydrophobic/amphiphilic exporter-1 (mainly G- bacteria), HAE1 family
VSAKIDEVLKDTPGLEAWVTIGGFSILDAASVPNVNTTFVVYQDWSKRGSALSQDRIVSHLNRELSKIKEAIAFVVIPPPIRGLGQTGGFIMMVEDRKGNDLQKLQDAAYTLVQAGNTHKGLSGLITTLNARSPQQYLDIDRTKALSFQVPLSNVFETLRAYLGSSFINLFNKFNQIYQVYIQANYENRMRTEDIPNLQTLNTRGEMVPLGSFLAVKHTTGSEIITRYNLYPAATIFGSSTPGTSSGQALTAMEKLANNSLPRGMGFE